MRVFIQTFKLPKLSLAKTVVLSIAACTVFVGVAYGVVNVFSSNEAEAGTRTGNVALVSDTSASGSSAVKFGTAPQTCPVSDTSHVPDGPDGMGGCWPGPLTTGPDVEPTELLLPEPGGGPGAGARYAFYSDTIIENKVINDDILVASGNVIIKNSIIKGYVEVYEAGSITVEDSITTTLGGPHTHALRSELSGGPQMALCTGNCSLVDSYSHDPDYMPGQEAHQSAWGFTGSEVPGPNVIQHSTLWCNVPPDPSPTPSGCTANLALQASFAPVANFTVDRNLFMPTETGGFCGTFGYSSTQGTGPDTYGWQANHIVVTNNIFKRGPSGQCGVYGPVGASNGADGEGNVWSNNKFDDGAVVNPVE